MLHDYDEKEIYSEENEGGYRISIVARLGGPNVTNIQYRIRIASPYNPDFPTDYIPRLEGFEQLGTLLVSLGELARKSRYIYTPEEAEAWAKILYPELIHAIAASLRKGRTGQQP